MIVIILKKNSAIDVTVFVPYIVFKTSDHSDLEALRDRFERCDELDAYSVFCDKMCACDFAWSMHDTRY